MSVFTGLCLSYRDGETTLGDTGVGLSRRPLVGRWSGRHCGYSPQGETLTGAPPLVLRISLRDERNTPRTPVTGPLVPMSGRLRDLSTGRQWVLMEGGRGIATLFTLPPRSPTKVDADVNIGK